MIRILHIMSTVTGGGVERRRLSLAKAFKETEIQMKLVGTFKSGNVAEQIEENGVEIIEIGDFNGPFHWSKHKKIQKIIEDFRPHIIHGAVYEGVTMAAINGFIKKVPIIILEETSDPQNRSAKADFLLRIFSFTADMFIAIAPNVADYLTNVAKVSKNKVITINNGVEIPRPVSADEIKNLKNQYLIKQDDFVIGTVGRLFNDHKKITDIIEAIFILRENKNIKLIIVGGGRDEESIKQKVTDLGLQEKIIFTGYQFDTAPFYKLMDVFCIASQREGFGLVAAEAMLHRLPVIATRVGGLQNVVVDGQTGFLVPSNSPKEIAKKIHEFFNNNELNIKMSNAGYQRAVENYTEERYVKDVKKLYFDLLKQDNISV